MDDMKNGRDLTSIMKMLGYNDEEIENFSKSIVHITVLKEKYSEQEAIALAMLEKQSMSVH